MGALSLALILLAAAPAGETPFPGLPWTDLDGREWAAEDLEGRVVVLDFWATWCAPCLAEFPHLRRLEDRYGDRGLVLMGVSLDTLDKGALRSFVLRHDLTWPQIHQSRGFAGELPRHFQVETVPATLVFDPQGRLVARDLRGRGLEAAVEALLDLAPARGSERTPVLASPSEDDLSNREAPAEDG